MNRIDNKLLSLLHCAQCQSERLSIDEDRAVFCENCGYSRAIDEDGILREPSMEVFDPTSVYERKTKVKYQSSEHALQYMQAYTRPRRFTDLHAVFVAKREQRAVEQALRLVASDLVLVLDLPAGTGKLAPIHAKFGYRVIAADAAVDMLRTGLEAWRNNHRLVGMMQTDVRQTGFRSGSVDCTICLRLMHMLPADIANEALRELARITKRMLIVSTAIRSRTIGSLIPRAAPAHGVAPPDLAEWHRRLAAIGEVQRTLFVARGITKEVISIVDMS